jgi:hypothetical protein
MHIGQVLFRQTEKADLYSSCEFTKNEFPNVLKKP